MDLRYILAQLRRRAWATAMCLLATAAMAFYVQSTVPALYQVQASLVLIPPSLAEDPGSNPFLSIGGLNPAADVLVRALNYSSFRETVAPSGGTRTFDVSRDTDASGPLLVVNASDVTAAGANEVLDQVVAQAPISMAQLQDDIGVTDIAMIDVLEIARESQPTIDTKSQQRALLMVVAAGLVVTVLGVGLLDRWLLGRKAAGTAPRPERREPGRTGDRREPEPEPARRGSGPRPRRRRVPTERPVPPPTDPPVGGVAQLQELIAEPGRNRPSRPPEETDATPFRGVKGAQ
ncbi:MAG: hypothetical protein KJ548_01900 [Actinobacteria bacterium]|nr:hypothetical protein [Actinomycetota bacterium]MCG2800448.1 hypothetical protein [Cellulomonas sp.]